MPQARLVLHTKYVDELEGIVEMKTYQVPKTMSTPHGYKYPLVYIRDGQRLVGYDNHERQGDHRHNRDLTLPYTFRSVDRLIDNFLSAVAAIKKEMPR